MRPSAIGIVENQQGAVAIADLAQAAVVVERGICTSVQRIVSTTTAATSPSRCRQVVDVVDATQRPGAAAAEDAFRRVAGGRAVPGSRGADAAAEHGPPPSEMASSEAPWKASHIDRVLKRPVTRRAELSAMPMAAGTSPGRTESFLHRGRQ